MKNTLSIIGIRFVFLLCILFVFCFNNGGLPFLYYITKFSTPLLQEFVPWFAAKFLNLSYTITEFTNGSGDTSYDYVLLLCVLLTAVFGTLIWSVLDRKRKSHKQLFYWLTVLLRFYVGFMLINYGVAKLNNGQFPSPGLGRLMQTYGNSSPMGLAWTFLGYSEGYKWFMFFAEMMGILLLFRKTATLGALLCLMTSLNIMQVRITQSRLAGEPADVMIRPRLSGIAAMDFHRATLAIAEGDRATQQVLPLIADLLGVHMPAVGNAGK